MRALQLTRTSTSSCRNLPLSHSWSCCGFLPHLIKPIPRVNIRDELWTLWMLWCRCAHILHYLASPADAYCWSLWQGSKCLFMGVLTLTVCNRSPFEQCVGRVILKQHQAESLTFAGTEAVANLKFKLLVLLLFPLVPHRSIVAYRTHLHTIYSMLCAEGLSWQEFRWVTWWPKPFQSATLNKSLVLSLGRIISRSLGHSAALCVCACVCVSKLVLSIPSCFG